MRVLHIANGYVFSKLYKAFVEQLSLKIENQTIFAPIRESNQKGLNKPEKINIKIIYALIVTKIIYRFLFHLKITKTLNKLQEECSVKEFDLIHAHTLFSDGAVAFKLKKHYKIPYIVTIRNTDINDFYKYLIHLRSYGLKILLESEKIVFLSKAYKERLFNNYIPEKNKDELLKKSIIIPNGIDNYWLNNINSIKKKLGKTIKLLFTGEIRKNKNLLGVIDAISLIENKNIEFTIVGEGLNDEISYLTKLKEKIKNNNKISLLPVVQKEELINYYRSADIFIMPSFTETFGLVYAEALSQGLPVIYTQGEGFDKVFPEKHIGVSVNSNDLRSIADGISYIIDNYNNIQKNCALASKKFSWETIAEVYLQHYSEIKDKSNNAN